MSRRSDAGAIAPREWVNRGDMDPACGTTMVDPASMAMSGGDFSCDAITVTPETDVGGSDRVMLIRSGSVFLNARDLGSALETIGARIENGEIVVTDVSVDGESELRVRAASREGGMILADAAIAYAGLGDVAIETVVSIGLPHHLDAPRRFDGETVYLPEKTSAWAAIRFAAEEEGVMSPRERETGVAEKASPIDQDMLEGMPADLGDRSDLMAMTAFSNLESDTCGNPCVWLNRYRGEGPDADEWDNAWSCQCEDDGVEPFESEWIGPTEDVLRALWEDLPEAGGRRPDAPSPG